jgi:hypothetical protein
VLVFHALFCRGEMMKAGRLFDPMDLGPWRDVVVADAGAQRR